MWEHCYDSALAGKAVSEEDCQHRQRHRLEDLPGTCEERSPPELGNWTAFAHFFGPKVSGDKAVTNGDKLGGMEFACFSGLKTESRAQRAPDFDRKQANLEAQAPHLPSDTKKQTFRSPF